MLFFIIIIIAGNHHIFYVSAPFLGLYYRASRPGWDSNRIRVCPKHRQNTFTILTSSMGNILIYTHTHTHAPFHEDLWESGGTAPRILNLGTRWRWMASFTPRPLYPWKKSPLVLPTS